MGKTVVALLIKLATLFFFVRRSSGSNVASNTDHSEVFSLQSMEKVFARSEEANQKSMATIAKSLKTSSSSNLLTQSLEQVADVAFGNKTFRKQPKGYSGIDGAR